MPTKTIKIAINTGAYQLGPVPPETQVTLECGYLFAKEARASIGEALEIKDTDAKNRSALERVAEHVVASWSFAQDINRADVAQFLIALYEEEPTGALRILERLSDAKRFGRPQLVDPEALGEG